MARATGTPVSVSSGMAGSTSATTSPSPMPRAAPGNRPGWYLTTTRLQDFLVRRAGDDIELT